MTTKTIQIPDDDVKLFEQVAQKMGWVTKEEDRGRGNNNAMDKLPYEFPRASIAVDMVVFGILSDVDELCVFVHRPKGKGDWWLSGRFMHCGRDFTNEVADDGDNWTLERTMMEALRRDWLLDISINGIRVTSEKDPETEVYTIKPNLDLICQLEAMSALDRDDRKIRVVSIPYMTLVSVKDKIPVHPRFAQWMPVSKLINVKNDFKPGEERLAHDHFDILKNGIKRLFQEVRTRPIGGNMNTVGNDLLDKLDKYVDKEELADKEKMNEYFLLPTEFEMSQLIHVYNVILQTMDVKMEKSNLLKRLIEKDKKDKGVVEKHGDKYRFVVQKYKDYKKYLNFGFNPKFKDEEE